MGSIIAGRGDTPKFNLNPDPTMSIIDISVENVCLYKKEMPVWASP